MYIIVILILLIYFVIKFIKKDKNLSNKKYDIIYSILFHQKIDYVNNCIENINKYNKNNKFLIIAHLSDELYKNKNLLNKKNVIINPIHFNKKKRNKTILKAIIDNFEFLKNNKINYNYCMTLSSTNRFVRQTPKFKKENLKNIFSKIDFPYNKMIQKNKLSKYKNIYDIFKKYNMNIEIGQVSGRLFNKDLIDYICYLTKKYKILNKNKIYDNFIEEIWLPTLSTHYLKQKQKSYCHIMIGKSKLIINEFNKVLNDLQSVFLLKKFPEDLNHPIYKLI